VLCCVVLYRSLEREEADAALLDSDKGSEMTAHKKALKVARIAFPFNIIGPDTQSQTRAVDT
jgi:hypothetical protein